MKNWVQGCIDWDISRNNMRFDGFNEHEMLKEELGELEDGVYGYCHDADGMRIDLEDPEYEMVDALGDIIKVAVSGLWKLGYDPDLVMGEVLREINSREQDPLQAEAWRMEGPDNQKWQKNKAQDPTTLYKADYTNCKLNTLTDIEKAEKEAMRNDMYGMP
jgi:hypothetical protein